MADGTNFSKQQFATKNLKKKEGRKKEKTVGPTLSQHLECYILKEKNTNKAVPHLIPTQKNNLSRSNMNPYKNIQIFDIQTRFILLFITSLDMLIKQSQGISVEENQILNISLHYIVPTSNDTIYDSNTSVGKKDIKRMITFRWLHSISNILEHDCYRWYGLRTCLCGSESMTKDHKFLRTCLM